MQHHPVSIFSTGKFSKLMEDYVDEHPNLQTLYHRPHRPESYSGQWKDKSAHAINREVLVEVLQDQYADLNIEKRYPRVFESIEELKQDSTFTVTTGHQLCLFTGPLYFIYKIVNAIRLAEELSEREKIKVVPVFWMATEDHDFEEVNHVWYGDLKYQWHAKAGNAVGRMFTDGVEEVILELRKVVSDTPSTKAFLELCERCYRSGQTLAQATRELATEVFGDRGLIVLDADDARLKKMAGPVFREDLIDNTHANLLESSNAILSDHYFVQVNPREVNLFYLDGEMRYRIERDGHSFLAVEGPHRWSASEIEEELSQHPERFSPNVILRPVYQEMILPNLAYIGGGGELAYWLQLKPIFDYHKIPFPILRLRNSVGFIRKKYWHKMQSLSLSLDEVCTPVFEQRRKYFADSLKLEGDLESLNEKASTLFDEMEALADRIDASLKGTAKAYRARQAHLMDNFEKKILRAVQRRETETSRMFDEIHKEVFPSGGLQERRDTWVTILERFGDSALEVLCDELDPFAHDFSWIVE